MEMHYLFLDNNSKIHNENIEIQLKHLFQNEDFSHTILFKNNILNVILLGHCSNVS